MFSDKFLGLKLNVESTPTLWTVSEELSQRLSLLTSCGDDDGRVIVLDALQHASRTIRVRNGCICTSTGIPRHQRLLVYYSPGQVEQGILETGQHSKVIRFPELTACPDGPVSCRRA